MQNTNKNCIISEIGGLRNSIDKSLINFLLYSSSLIMKKKYLSFIFILIFITTSLFSCGRRFFDREVKVILEDGDFSCATKVLSQEVDSDFEFDIIVEKGKTISSCSYDNYTVTQKSFNTDDINTFVLTLHSVKYSMVVSLTVQFAFKVSYCDETETENKFVYTPHERYNTDNDYTKYKKEGYKFIGYINDGNYIPMGSRVEKKEDISLNVLYQKETGSNLFTVDVIDDNYVSLSDYSGNDSILVIPDKINGKTVLSISENCFENKTFSKAILPAYLNTIKDNAFKNCTIDEIYFYDNLKTVSDESFSNCTIHTVYINAIKAPKYSGNYFDSYPDKIDRLVSLKDKKKIILYSGSSTRFGYDSSLIDSEFSDYEVINLGVYAYTNSLPQIEILSNYITSEDIIITSPEFDTIETQIDLKYEFDYALFCMCESNYSILSLLDISKYSLFFSSFNKYQEKRQYLSDKSYLYSVNSFDEDGNSVETSTYNKYWDYILYREDNIARKSFGIRRAFYNKKYFDIEFINRFNAAYNSLNCKVYYFYSPRMNISISDDSNSETIAELGEYLKENINLPFLDDIDDSLLDPYYFYNTDNHLSTTGAINRTNRLIGYLHNILELTIKNSSKN